MTKKLAVIAPGLLLTLLFGALKAEEPQAGPEGEFFKGLKKLEQSYIKAAREQAEKAASVEVFRINGDGEALDPFDNNEIEGFIRITRGGNGYKHKIVKSGKAAKQPDEIKAWANAVLPPEEQPFAMCIPEYGFAVRFLEASGKEIYSTLICLNYSTSEISYPRYSSRLGFDVKAVKKLIEASGLTTRNQELRTNIT